MEKIFKSFLVLKYILHLVLVIQTLLYLYKSVKELTCGLQVARVYLLWTVNKTFVHFDFPISYFVNKTFFPCCKLVVAL